MWTYLINISSHYHHIRKEQLKSVWACMSIEQNCFYVEKYVFWKGIY